MITLDLSKILNGNANLLAEKLKDEDEKVDRMIAKTKRLQEEILDLKEVNLNDLKLVVQL